MPIYNFLCEHCGRELEEQQVSYSLKNVWMEFAEEIRDGINQTADTAEYGIILSEQQEGIDDIKKILSAPEAAKGSSILNMPISPLDDDQVRLPRLSLYGFMQVVYKLDPKKNETRKTLENLYAQCAYEQNMKDGSEEAKKKARRLAPRVKPNVQIMDTTLLEEQTVDAEIKYGKIPAYLRINGKQIKVNRVCPYCGGEISSNAGIYPEIRIGVVGTARQGKTTLLSAVADRFSGQGCCGITMECDENFQKRCLDYYRENVAVPKTQQSDQTAYRFSMTIHETGKAYNLLFIDIAGELLMNQSDEGTFYANYSNFMENVDGFWCCTDYYQVGQLRGATNEMGLGATGTAAMTVQLDDHKLQHMLSMLSSGDGAGEKPCALLMVKSDLINESDIQRMRGRQQPGAVNNTEQEKLYGYMLWNNHHVVNENVVNNLTKSIRGFIEENNRWMLSRYQEAFEYIGCMTCSAYGHGVNKFKAAFSANNSEVVIYQVGSADGRNTQQEDESLFLPDKAWDIEVLKDVTDATAGAEREAIQAKRQYKNVGSEEMTLFFGEDIGHPVTIRGIRIRLPEGMETCCCLRIFASSNTYVVGHSWYTNEAGGKLESCIRMPDEASCETVRICFGDGNETYYRVQNHPKPDQVQMPLLWMLAMLGKYPTVGLQEQVIRHFLKTETKKQPKLFNGTGEETRDLKDSRRVMCGNKDYHPAENTRR